MWTCASIISAMVCPPGAVFKQYEGRPLRSVTYSNYLSLRKSMYLATHKNARERILLRSPASIYMKVRDRAKALHRLYVRPSAACRSAFTCGSRSLLCEIAFLGRSLEDVVG